MLLAPLLIGASPPSRGAGGLTQTLSVLHVESYQEPRDYLEDMRRTTTETSPPVSKNSSGATPSPRRRRRHGVVPAGVPGAQHPRPEAGDARTLLVPCVLGWTVYATLDPWTLETATSFKTSRGWFYHRDDLFAVAALAYHGLARDSRAPAAY